MPVMDEFKEERERIKSAPLKERIAYYTYYYKYHVLGSVLGLVMVISLIHTIVTNKDTALFVTMVNAFEKEEVSEIYEAECLEELGISLEDYAVTFDTSMYLNYENMDANFSTYVQKFITLVAAGEIDVFVSDASVYEQMYPNGTYMDLSTVLTEAEMEQYKESFYYIDNAVVKEYDIAMDDVDNDYVLPEYDHRDYESMEEPVAIGIYLDPENEFFNSYAYQESDVIISIVSSAQSLENALAYLKYVVE